MTEGQIVEWLKKPRRSSCRAVESVLVVESDKADMGCRSEDFQGGIHCRFV